MFAFEPSEYLKLSSASLQLIGIHNLPILVRFHFTLLLVNLLMETGQDVCVTIACLEIIDPAMDQHLIPASNQKSDMALSWGWCLSRIS